MAAKQWEQFRGKLAEYENPPDWQDKVEEAKKKYLHLTSVNELGKEFRLNRDKKKGLEEEIKLINTEQEALSQLLKDLLQAEGQQLVRLTSGETIYLQVDPYPSVVDQATVRDWALSSGQAELLTVNFMTLSGLVKGLLTDGENPPPGVNVFLKTSVRVRNNG